MQWKAHEIERSNLVPGSIITIEDYQMNLEVCYREAPTSMAYSSHKTSVAMYPLCVEYLDEEEWRMKKDFFVKEELFSSLRTSCMIINRLRHSRWKHSKYSNNSSHTQWPVGNVSSLKEVRFCYFQSYKFFLTSENSRATPGQETVSVRYGVRKPSRGMFSWCRSICLQGIVLSR